MWQLFLLKNCAAKVPHSLFLAKIAAFFAYITFKNFKVSLANTIVGWHKGNDIMPSATDDCRLDMLVHVNNVNNVLVRLCNVRKPQTKIAADDSLIF